MNAVKTMIADAGDLPFAGLRIAVERGTRDVAVLLDVATRPEKGDEVVHIRGARVFLEPDAAALLDDKLLDVRRSHGRSSFRVANQPF